MIAVDDFQWYENQNLSDEREKKRSDERRDFKMIERKRDFQVKIPY